MTRTHYRRFFRATIAACALAVAVPLVAAASHDSAVRGQHPDAATSHVVFTFGREGGNIRPLTVSIDDTGTVTASIAGSMANPHVQLSRDAIDGLLKLATAEGFFTMPSRMVGHGLPDIGGRYITIHTTTATKTVHVRFVRNAAFDQLYAVLSAAAGVAS